MVDNPWLLIEVANCISVAKVTMEEAAEMLALARRNAT